MMARHPSPCLRNTPNRGPEASVLILSLSALVETENQLQAGLRASLKQLRHKPRPAL